MLRRRPLQFWLIGLGLLVWLSALVWLTLPIHKPRSAEAPAGTAGSQTIQTPTGALASGQVSSRADFARDDTRVKLEWLADASTSLRSAVVPVRADGTFVIEASHLPLLPTTDGTWRGRLTAEAPGHQAMAVDLIFSRSAEGVTISPSQIPLRLEPFDLRLTVLLLMPALAALWFALLQLRKGTGSVPAWLYATVCGGAWLLVSLSFAIKHVFEGQHWIALFLPDAQASSGLLVFAFLGCLVYLVYSVYHRESDYFTKASKLDRDRLLRTVGGRMLAAPYVALVAWLVLSRVFPTLQAGAEVLFFGFFTGLWVKVVLDFLDSVGRGLLSQAARDRLKDRLQREEAPELPPAPVRRAAYLPPAVPGYFEAIAEARKTFHDYDSVLGVGPGHRFSRRDGQTDEAVITVYVDEKKDLPPGALERIPPSFQGVRTDVVQVGPAEPGECDPVAPNLFWDKLSPRAAGNPDSRKLKIAWEGDVLVLENLRAADDYLVRWGATADKRFSPFRAYEDVRSFLGDAYDFVAFVVDPDIKYKSKFSQGDYYLPAFNSTKGIAFFRGREAGGYFDERPTGISKLLGFQVHCGDQLRLRNLLHELGHAWLAYVQRSSGRTDLLDGSTTHWSKKFDDSCQWFDSQGIEHRGASCMSEDKGYWHEESGRWRWSELPDRPAAEVGPEASPFGFCFLDLYLMGLLPAAEVGPMRLIEQSGRPEDGAAVTNISMSEIVGANGTRVPACVASEVAHYRQIFVVVTTGSTGSTGSNDPDGADSSEGVSKRAKELAARVNEVRQDHARNVAVKTGNRMVLHTDRQDNSGQPKE